MQIENVAQFIIFASGGVYNFVAVMNFCVVRNEIKVQEVNADDDLFSSLNIIPSVTSSTQ